MKTPIQNVLEDLKNKDYYTIDQLIKRIETVYLEDEKMHIINAANFIPNDELTSYEYYEKNYNNKYKIRAEQIVNDYMKLCGNNYDYAKKCALFALELMQEVCNNYLIYTKQPVSENDKIYNNLVQTKNELNKLKTAEQIAKERQSERFMESVRNSNLFEKIMGLGFKD